MRGICGLIFTLGLSVFLIGATATAQDAPKAIAIQVVVGADGSIKIIDAKTGKEIDAGVIKMLMKPGAIDAQQLDKKKIDELRRALDKAIEAEFNRKPDAKRPAGKPIEIELELQPRPNPDRPKVIPIEKLQHAGDPSSVDKKLDLILRQLGDLRKDVDGIKRKLDGKKPDNLPLWQVVPKDKGNRPGVIEIELVPANPKDAKPGGLRFEFKAVPVPGGKEADKVRKPDGDPAVQKALEYLRKKQAESSRPPMPAEAQRLEELQRSLDRLRQELDALKKSPK